MGAEESSENGRLDSPTVESVEVLIEKALSHPDDIEDWQKQEEAVLDLSMLARETAPEIQAMAFWGLGEIAKDRRDAVGSAALDKLDQIAKYSSVEPDCTLAADTIRNVLKAT